MINEIKLKTEEKEEKTTSIIKKLFEVLVSLAIIAVVIRIFNHYKSLDVDSFLLGMCIVIIVCIVNEVIGG